jgi:hypothetical protein
MTDVEAVTHADDAGFRIYKNNGRWHWSAKFWVDDGRGAFDTAVEAWEDICRSYPAAGEE